MAVIGAASKISLLTLDGGGAPDEVRGGAGEDDERYIANQTSSPTPSATR